MRQPPMRLSGVVLGTPDPRALAAFYQKLLGWNIVNQDGPRPGAPPEDGWVLMRPSPAATGVSLAFEYEAFYTPPVWPSVDGRQQIMAHIDIAVEDLDEAVAWAIEAGARLAEYQPQKDVRVMLDPAGHPFCFFPGQV